MSTTALLPRPVMTAALASAVAACLLTAGCSSTTSAAAHSSTRATSSAAAANPTPSSTPSSTSTVAGTTITIKNFRYTISGAASKGTAVRVSNDDAEAHTVTADSGNAFNVTIQPGKSATFTAPATAGSYKFHCNYHSNMHATLVVTN